MEIREAEVFLAVADELHFGRAAERLQLAQPPVTRVIKRLEEELGTALFNRTTRRVELTVAGQAPVAPARALIAAHDEAIGSVTAAARGELGTVRVVFAGAATHVMVGRLAARVHAHFPGLVLRLESGNYVAQDIRRIAAGKADIGLGRWDFVPEGVRTRVIAYDSFRLAVPSGHRLARRQAVSLREVAAEPFVALPLEGNWLSGRLGRLARDAGFEPRIAQEAPDSWTLMALVAAGVGCALTLASIAASVASGRIAFLPLLGAEPAGDLRIGWAADPLTPAARTVLAVASEVLPTPPPPGQDAAAEGHG
jgi:DNA-binding transcriptional LysR family regulator